MFSQASALLKYYNLIGCQANSLQVKTEKGMFNFIIVFSVFQTH